LISLSGAQIYEGGKNTSASPQTFDFFACRRNVFMTTKGTKDTKKFNPVLFLS
jgi:hypothetical protein